jgi:hypothetical protein
MEKRNLFMSCIYCGASTDPNQTICEKCRRNPEVIVLPPAERENFNGLTIEQDLNGNEYHRSQELDPHSDSNSSSSSNPNPRVYVRHINLGSSGGWLTKLIIAGVFLVIILVALPLALLLLLCFIIGRFLIKPKRH